MRGYEGASEGARCDGAARPDASFGSVARAQLQLGNALDHLGRQSEATAAYRAAIAATGVSDPLGVAARARAALRAIEQ